jgi:hypothetical protein
MEIFSVRDLPSKGDKVCVLDRWGYWTCATYSKDYKDVFDVYMSAEDMNIHAIIRTKDIVQWFKLPPTK